MNEAPSPGYDDQRSQFAFDQSFDMACELGGEALAPRARGLSQQRG